MSNGKTIIILGGSYNPPHDGHMEAGEVLHAATGADEVWMLFSVNPYKDPSKYAALHHRMAMGALLAKHYPHVPFVMSDYEERVGIHETWHVLNSLRQERPDDRFIWTMGADSLIEFHRWHHADRIMNDFPVVVIARHPHTENALSSQAAQHFAHLRFNSTADLLASGKGGWVLVDELPNNPHLSSKQVMRRLREGDTNISPVFNDVAQYILDNGLYGLGRDKNPPKPPSRNSGQHPAP